MIKIKYIINIYLFKFIFYRRCLDGRGAAISVVLLQSKTSFPTGKFKFI